MSRNFVILMMVMCAAIAGLIAFSRLRSKPVEQQAVVNTTEQPTTTPVAPPIRVNPATTTTPVMTPTTQIPVVAVPPAISQARTTVAARTTISAINTITNGLPDGEPDVKPLPVLIKEYAATTNRDDRLDLMMDIADLPGPESIRALTQLFEAETDPDLKVDLLDSLLGIEGFPDEKLKMLTAGTKQGLPGDVRQSAIDGLIDLDDQRVIPVLNGLLNDPDEEIRESAKDAIEMLQSQPAVRLKP
ncbi:MAG TPA: HEAT repeat domain-containing protein [Candidatus Limnocylindria bacterium]|nr:HEAT repeat domain-containing protein [Candidatus Limnocylindria bacterium]